MTKDELKKLEYQSWQNGNEWTDDELDFIIDHNCSCDNCGESVESLSDFPNIETDKLLCEDCYIEENYDTCPCCEDYYSKYETPETDEIHLFIGKELAEENNMKIGIYKALKYPFFYGDCITGFDAFFNDSLELVKETDLNSIKKKLGHSSNNIQGELICPECAKRYSGKTFIHHNYCSDWAKVHLNIYERGLIAEGL